jgi:hypothetical protein
MEDGTDIEWLRANHQEVTGSAFSHFMCPITLVDEQTALMDGHILNKAIKQAARWCVIQRKDVDNHFGRTIEPDLIKWLNVDFLTLNELLDTGRQFMVDLPDGTKCPGIPIRDRGAAQRFPTLPICDEDGNHITSIYVKTDPARLAGLKGLKVAVRLSVQDSAIVGAWLKVAYLAIFRHCGYRYVYTAAGGYVRRALAGFYRYADSKDDAVYFFSKFRGCVHVLLGDQVPHFQNTIEHRTVLLHRVSGIEFALSCLFRVNRLLHVVTVPFPVDGSRWFGALKRYDHLLRHPATPHEILAGCVQKDCVTVAPDPLRLTYEQDIAKVREMLAHQLQA